MYPIIQKYLSKTFHILSALLSVVKRPTFKSMKQPIKSKTIKFGPLSTSFGHHLSKDFIHSFSKLVPCQNMPGVLFFLKTLRVREQEG